MKKGELWYGDFPQPIGRRPVVILSRDEACAVRNSVTIAEVTTKIWGIAVEVPLGSEDGLPKHCVVNLDTITTVSKRFLIERIALLSADKIDKIHKIKCISVAGNFDTDKKPSWMNSRIIFILQRIITLRKPSDRCLRKKI